MTNVVRIGIKPRTTLISKRFARSGGSSSVSGAPWLMTSKWDYDGWDMTGYEHLGNIPMGNPLLGESIAKQYGDFGSIMAQTCIISLKFEGKNGVSIRQSS